jgi:hypothetical protein
VGHDCDEADRLIDSLTADRDEWRASGEGWLVRATDIAGTLTAAEAEVKRLREALMAHHEAGVLARTVGVETHQAWGMRCPFCAAALATPPSEGGQS